VKKLILLLFLSPFLSLAQLNLDSLWKVWNNPSNPDTSRIISLTLIINDEYLFKQPDSAFFFAQLQYELAEEKDLKKEMGNALNVQATSFAVMGNYDDAIIYFEKSLAVRTEIDDKSGMAGSYNNLGIVYSNLGDYDKSIEYYNKGLDLNSTLGNNTASLLRNVGILYGGQGDLINEMDYYEQSLEVARNFKDEINYAYGLNAIGLCYFGQGDYDEAIDYYTRCLKLSEKIKDEAQIADALHSIGLLYAYQDESEKAIEYYTQALEIENSRSNKKGIARNYMGLGNAYGVMEDYEKSMEYYTISLELSQEIGDKNGIAFSLTNIGSHYEKQHEYNKAIDCFIESLKVAEEIGERKVIANALNNIGDIYKIEGDNNKALSYYKRSLSVAKEISDAVEIQNAAKSLSAVYKEMGNYKEGFEMYELYITERDSLQSKNNQKELIRQEYKYAYEKQATADSLKTVETTKLKDAQIVAEQAQNKQHEQQKYFLFGGLGLALLFGGFIFNRFRVTQKQKGIIEEQKQLVDTAFDQLESKNTEILDSIQYAKRIQNAILPPDKVVKEYLNDSFIYYKPKDIVAGDFYWMEPTPEGVLFASADCTGHGVPGALVSVLCNNSLNRSVREYKLTDPGTILNKTREIVIQEFERSEDEVKDGMDIALCSLKGNTLKYSGANNPLWIIRKDAQEVEVIKADKQPIGQFEKVMPYTTHTLDLNHGDAIYIFSDGYIDQFGGAKGKKFKSRPFKNLLLSIQDKTMEEQYVLIDSAFQKWKGELEQIDDVCVIGVKL
jgi:tetratricopeptide (TPR) repeat protein/serine phosphatase RsbU (regulator of sigma subunit)